MADTVVKEGSVKDICDALMAIVDKLDSIEDRLLNLEDTVRGGLENIKDSVDFISDVATCSCQCDDEDEDLPDVYMVMMDPKTGEAKAHITRETAEAIFGKEALDAADDLANKVKKLREGE